MIKNGVDKGVIQISDVIKYLQEVEEEQGDLKFCINGQYIYNLKETVEIDEENNCVDFKDDI